MLSREGKQTDRGAVGAEFIGYNRRRREALLLQEFPHQPNCRPSVPAGLNQEIQDFALTVHGTPTLNPPRIGPTEFLDPSSNCLIRDVETTLGKQVLNVPIAQRETAIEPDGMLDDDRWKAVTTVGYLAHPETLKHRPCRSHAVNVTMPSGGLIMTLGPMADALVPLRSQMQQKVQEREILRVFATTRGHNPAAAMDVAKREALVWTQNRSGGQLPQEAWDGKNFEFLAGGRTTLVPRSMARTSLSGP